MNIQNRLKKLETEAVNVGFCDCKRVKTESFLQDLTEDAETNEPVLSGEAVPDVCEDCNKPIEKKVIIIQLVDAEARAKFPEETKNAVTFNLKS